MIPVITIDGPAGSGKSTVAQDLAKHFNVVYLNTGAIYRAVALLLDENGEHNIETSSKSIMNKVINELFEFYHQDKESHRIFIRDRDITDVIKTPHFSEKASIFSQDKRVRLGLLPLQRKIVEESHGAVVDGRDMGTVVFPDALLKIFLTATPEIRALRRQTELLAKNKNIEIHDLIKEIHERDERDSSRSLSPLRPAEDAIILDSSNLSPAQVTHKIIEYCHSRNISFTS